MIAIEEKQTKKRMVKYEFTYLDYLYYCDRENWKRIVKGEYPIWKEEHLLEVNEEEAEYNAGDEESSSSKTGDKKHDKIFKEILQNKEEIAKFINKFIKYEVKTK